MITLTAFNQETNASQLLDIDSEEVIDLNFSVADIRDFTQRNSSYSQTFSLPFTPTNDAFFGYNFNVNISTGDFSLYRRTNAVLMVDGLPQLEGYLFINSVNLTSERYEVAVIGDVGNLKDELGDKKLVDLDADWLNGFTHELTIANIQDSWDDDITYASVGADKSAIKYPIISWAVNNEYFSMFNGQDNDITTVAGAIWPSYLKPMMKVKTLFDRILEEAGYSYTSSFINDDEFNFSDIYITLSTENETVQYRWEQFSFRAITDGNQNVTTSPAVVPFLNTTTGAFDPSTVWDNGGYFFLTEAAAKYFFKLHFKLYFKDTSGGGATDADFGYKVRVDGTDIVVNDRSNGEQINVSDGKTKEVDLLFGFNVSFNQQVDVQVYNYDTGDTYQVLTGSYFELQDYWSSSIDNVQTIYLDDNMPDITQVDFLKGILQRFNMFVVPDETNPKQLIIEPYPTYMDDGVIVDWTSKLDESKEVAIEPTINIRKKNIKFQNAADDVWLAKNKREYTRKPIGSLTLFDESDLVNGEFVYDSIFGDSVLKLISTAANFPQRNMWLPYHHGINNDGNTQVLKKQLPRLYYFKKKSLDLGTYKLYEPSLLWDYDVSDYGYAGNFSDVPTTANDFDLNWSLQSIYNFSQTIGIPPKNVFDEFWKRYLNEIYSDEARVLKAHFYLTPLDIQNLKFNNKIFVKDCFYRINKITGYNANGDGLAKVELLKIFEAQQGLINCTIRVDSLNVDGSVDFVDESGTATDPTRKCCEQLGYTFVDGEVPKCYWRIIADGGSELEINVGGVGV